MAAFVAGLLWGVPIGYSLNPYENFEQIIIDEESFQTPEDLASKEQQASEMRTKLGITPLAQIKTTFENIGKSETYVTLIAQFQSPAW